MVGYKNAEMALCNQLKMRPNRIVRENTLKNVSPLCQRVSPSNRLQTLCTSILCQRVTLYFKKNHSKKNYNLTVTQLQRIILTGGQAHSRLSHVTLNVLARSSQRSRTAQDEATIEKRIPLGYIAKKNKKLAQLTQKHLHELLLFSIFAADLSNTDAKIFA